MKNILLSTVAVFSMSAVASAADVGGSISIDVAENSAGSYVAETNLVLGASQRMDVGLAFGGFEFESVDGGDLTIDEWQIGIALPIATLSFGNQGDIFVSNDFEIVGGDTIANPSSDHESLIVDFGDAAVMVGFTDIKNDLGDIENIQGSYTLAVAGIDVTAVGDYNVDTENFIVGAKVDSSFGDFNVGKIVTYTDATETFGYELSAGYSFVTSFINGDNNEALQNVGAGVEYDLNGLGLYAEGTYNVNTDENSVGAGVNFSF